MTLANKKAIKKSFFVAFKFTLPILAGFWFIGITYGLMMKTDGFSFLYPLFMSMCIFAGSSEFVVAKMLLDPFSPVSTFITILLVNARHLFYGISMLDRFRGTGIKQLYLIFGMCDETFSINYTVDIPEDIDRGWFMFWVTLLNYTYWVSGATLGGLFGELLRFNTQGIEFAMTGMFVVIFIDQWKKDRNHTSELIGLCASVLCLVAFGSHGFMLPSMGLILLCLTIFRRYISSSLSSTSPNSSSTMDSSNLAGEQ